MKDSSNTHCLSRAAETASIKGGVIYIEPNYDYTASFEMVPRAGIGIAYLSIPGGFSSVAPYQIQPDGSTKYTPFSASHLDPFREDLDINIIERENIEKEINNYSTNNNFNKEKSYQRKGLFTNL